MLQFISTRHPMVITGPKKLTYLAWILKDYWMDLVTGLLAHSLAYTCEEEGAFSLSHVHIDKADNSLSEVGAQGCRWRHWSSSSSSSSSSLSSLSSLSSSPLASLSYSVERLFYARLLRHLLIWRLGVYIRDTRQTSNLATYRRLTCSVLFSFCFSSSSSSSFSSSSSSFSSLQLARLRRTRDVCMNQTSLRLVSADDPVVFIARARWWIIALAIYWRRIPFPFPFSL